jgi:hypothetical protein
MIWTIFSMICGTSTIFSMTLLTTTIFSLTTGTYLMISFTKTLFWSTALNSGTFTIFSIIFST